MFYNIFFSAASIQLFFINPFREAKPLKQGLHRPVSVVQPLYGRLC